MCEMYNKNTYNSDKERELHRMEKQAGLYEKVYDYILEQIFHQKLSYGQKVLEEEISKDLEISRTPIREALRKLESDGLVEILPKRCAQIVTLTEKDIRDLGIVKLQLDFLTAQLAIFHGSNADFKRLEQINDEMHRAVEDKDIYTALKKDMEFHKTYMSISGNPQLMQFQSQIQLKILLYQSIRMRDTEHTMDASVYDHQSIIEALYSREPEQVLSHIIPHLAAFYGLDIDVYSVMVADFMRGRAKVPEEAHRYYAPSKLQEQKGEK